MTKTSLSGVAAIAFAFAARPALAQDVNVDTKDTVAPSGECPTGTTVQSDGTCMSVHD